MELFRIGVDTPLLQKEISMRIFHRVTATINSARQPVKAKLLHDLRDMNHWVLLPSKTIVRPFPVNLDVRVFLDSIFNEASGFPEHTALLSTIAFKDLLALPC
jgi:hypothetical protein